MEIIGVRGWLKKCFLLSLFMYATAGEIWLIISISSSKKIDTLLLIMTILVSIIEVLLLIDIIIKFLKKKNAVIIDKDLVIINNIKSQKVKFDEIKNIQYKPYRINGVIGIHKLRTGDLIFTLNDDKRLYVKEIKNVRQTCNELRKIVLKENNENGKD